MAFAEWSFAGLLLLALVGIGITDFSSRNGLWYWLSVAPVFAIVSAAVAWRRARTGGENATRMLARQALHWAALVPALGVVYLFESTGRLNREDAGLVSLLVLALTTLLAGVHFDWRLAGLGAVLGVASAGAAFIEEFFWMIVTPVLLVAMIYFWWRRAAARTASRPKPEPAPASMPASAPGTAPTSPVEPTPRGGPPPGTSD